VRRLLWKYTGLTSLIYISNLSVHSVSYLIGLYERKAGLYFGSEMGILGMKRLLGIWMMAAALTVSSTTISSADYKVGMKAYQSGEYAIALREWKLLADKGHAAAQNNLGVIYSRGRGVTQDFSIAVEWYRKSAEQGYAKAQNNLGAMYLQGRGVVQDHTKAVKWYRKAAALGHAKAQNDLGTMYWRGKGVAQDHMEAVKWNRMSAQQGYARAQNDLGTMYLQGNGVAQSNTEAEKWYRKAAEQGYVKAQNNLKKISEKGEGKSEERHESNKAHLTDFEAGTKAYKAKDFATALLKWKPVAELGNMDAQFNLGFMYYNGQGVAQSYEKAVKWYRMAADQGDVISQHNLGNMYNDGRGVTQNYKEAAKWYLKAAEQEDSNAQYYLGIAYENGQGVIQNYGEAVKWYRKAAELGHVKAKQALNKPKKMDSGEMFKTEDASHPIPIGAYLLWVWILGMPVYIVTYIVSQSRIGNITIFNYVGAIFAFFYASLRSNIWFVFLAMWLFRKILPRKKGTDFQGLKPEAWKD
jgi:TPR repeat protein